MKGRHQSGASLNVERFWRESNMGTARKMEHPKKGGSEVVKASVVIGLLMILGFFFLMSNLMTSV